MGSQIVACANQLRNFVMPHVIGLAYFRLHYKKRSIGIIFFQQRKNIGVIIHIAVVKSKHNRLAHVFSVFKSVYHLLHGKHAVAVIMKILQLFFKNFGFDYYFGRPFIAAANRMIFQNRHCIFAVFAVTVIKRLCSRCRNNNQHQQNYFNPLALYFYH